MSKGVYNHNWQLTIKDLWVIFNLPSKPARSCKSPFREDKHPSFSVSPCGLFWHDFGINEGGGVLDFIAKAKAIGVRDAGKMYARLLREKGGKF